MKIKTKLTTLIVTSLLSASTFSADLFLEWTVPTNKVADIQQFNIRSTNVLGGAVTNWPVLVSIPVNTPIRTTVGTNYLYSYDLPGVVPGFKSYVLSGYGSNFWGVTETFLATNSTPAVLDVDLSNVSFAIKIKK